MPVGELTVPAGSVETLGVIEVRRDFTNARSLFFGAEVSLAQPAAQ
jgi:hypothetical protein